MKSAVQQLLLRGRKWGQNLFSKPDEFTDESWTGANAIASADGTLTSSGAAGYLFPTDTALLIEADGKTFEWFVDAVAGSATSMTLLGAAAATYSAVFDLSGVSVSGITANTDATIEDMGYGVRRCKLVMYGVTNNAYSELQIGRMPSGQTIRLVRASLRSRR